ncbi:hypothetical protein E3U23_04020 [Erythrobacter litoralis]|uniref:OprO/OprP family phosphate-selective porin n=1 Tax=Erythrobacter litoralis TaxID=39960 RepID=UPI002435F08D|nr:porin [Erythrobacter litoralis]MDG6078357.1 hypothetical protein [Erythrobacter litoralis]
MVRLILRGFALGTLALASPIFAQSAEDDSELFSEDEQFLRIGTDDENITFAPFVQLDAGYSDTNRTSNDTDARIRLARLYVFATKGDFSGTFAYDFKSDLLRYAFGAYQIDDSFKVQVGQQDEPFSLQDYSGSRFLPFAEAGRSAALIPGDNVGIVARYSGNNYSLAGGVFGGDLNNGLAEGGVAITGRATFAPVYEQSRIERGGDATQDGLGTQRVEDLLHFGAGVSARFDIDDPLNFTSNANSSILTRSLATQPELPSANSLLRLNLEAARSVGSFSLQSEFTAARIDTDQVEGTAHAGYLYASYFLTGERRGYSRGSGTFGRVIPINPIDEGGFGAIEVGARADYLDLSDLEAAAGAEWGLTGVVNAYLTKRITLTADYSFSKVTAGANDGLEAHAITGRVQFAY